MNVLVRFMRLFNAKKGKFEIWDTSAVSAWFERLKSTLSNPKSNVTIVIPEGVIHELSVGRHNHEQCKIAYEFIDKCKSDRLIKVVAEDKMIDWPIDQQVVATAKKFHKKGYNTVLVTCDRDERRKAEMRGIPTELLYVPKRNITANKPVETKVAQKPQSEASIKPKVTQEKVDVIPETLDEFEVPCITKDKKKFIDVNHKIGVYEPNGKRRIGRNDLVQVNITDKIEYLGTIYEIISYKDNSITFRRKLTT